MAQNRTLLVNGISNMPLLFLLVFGVFILVGCDIQQVDMVVHNARIYKGDPEFGTAEAMAIKDGKIVELGAERQILNKYVADQVIDARTRIIFPGFIDAHSHFLGYGLSLRNVNLLGTTSWQDAVDKAKAHHAAQGGSWVIGRGWDQSDWENTAMPDRTLLDEAFPDIPVLLRRIDGHAAVANGAALRKANITAATTVEGGIITVVDGEPTGLLLDNAVDLIIDVVPQPTAGDKKQALMQAQANCFAVGLTSLTDAGLDVDEITIIKDLQAAGDLKIRVYAMVSDDEDNLAHYLETGIDTTDRLTVRSFKFYADGALGSRGACLIEPYADVDTVHHGLMLTEEEHFRKTFKELYDKGFQVNTHCIGDSANRLVLDLYGEMLGGPNDKRWRIEHAQVVEEGDLDKFREFTIIPSVQPTHATSDMYWAGDRLGHHREHTAYAYKELLQQNGIIALGTDFPVEDISPIKTFYAAVVRKDAHNFPEGGYQTENSLTRKETLRGMTLWAAMSEFREGQKGTLEPGKVADFIILDRDIMKVEEDQLLDTQVIETYVNGERVYKR